MNKAVAETLCAVVGTVWKEIDEGETDGGSFLRMKVTIDINKPLCRGRLISLSHGEQSWVSFKYKRLPNICYQCGCLKHGDRDCDLWIESEGNLTKESQVYGAWIRAAPFVNGRNPVVKVLGFYAAKKAQQKQGAEERGMNSPVEQNSDQLPTMAHAQTEATARFREACNETSAESDTADVIAELVKSGGRASGERFEERFKEIDMEMGRFDKMMGVFLGDNLEEEIVGIKDQKPARKADESTQKLADRHAENSDRHAENVAGTEGFSQSRVHEANLVRVLLPTLHCVIFQILWAVEIIVLRWKR